MTIASAETAPAASAASAQGMWASAPRRSRQRSSRDHHRRRGDAARGHRWPGDRAFEIRSWNWSPVRSEVQFSARRKLSCWVNSLAERHSDGADARLRIWGQEFESLRARQQIQSTTYLALATLAIEISGSRKPAYMTGARGHSDSKDSHARRDCGRRKDCGRRAG
jgi:hypothetical protein